MEVRRVLVQIFKCIIKCLIFNERELYANKRDYSY